MQTFTVRVWDLPIRIFHWLLAIAVVGALVSIKLGSQGLVWHGRFGHLIIGLLTFRLVWGLVGSTHARFWNFVRGPRAVLSYLQGGWQGLGHSPLGALAVLALLGLIGFQAITGLFANDDIVFSGPLAAAVSGGTSTLISGWHRSMEWWIYAMLALHIGAILFYALVLRRNLVLPMLVGRQRVTDPEARDAQGGGPIALVLALAAAVLALWVANGSWIPVPPPPPDLGW